MAFEQKLLKYTFSSLFLLGGFVYLFTTIFSLERDLLQEVLHRILVSLLYSYQKDNYECGIKLTSFTGQAFTGSLPMFDFSCSLIPELQETIYYKPI